MKVRLLMIDPMEGAAPLQPSYIYEADGQIIVCQGNWARPLLEGVLEEVTAEQLQPHLALLYGQQAYLSNVRTLPDLDPMQTLSWLNSWWLEEARDLKQDPLLAKAS